MEGQRGADSCKTRAEKAAIGDMKTIRHFVSIWSESVRQGVFCSMVFEIIYEERQICEVL